jgi:hypothetical protein
LLPLLPLLPLLLLPLKSLLLPELEPALVLLPDDLALLLPLLRFKPLAEVPEALFEEVPLAEVERERADTLEEAREGEDAGAELVSEAEATVVSEGASEAEAEG